MKYFITILMFVILSGCNKKEEQPKNNNSEFLSVQKDSLILIEQEKVIADIKFNMAEKEVKMKIKKFIHNSQKLDYDYGSFKTYDYLIGNYKFSEYGVRDYYYEKKLYKFEIEGDLIEWKYLDTELKEQVKHIYNVITPKYGKPNLSYEILASYQMNEDYSYLIYQWKIGKKEIEIRVEDTGSYYRVNVLIFLADIEKLLREKEKLKEKEQTDSAKEIF